MEDATQESVRFVLRRNEVVGIVHGGELQKREDPDSTQNSLDSCWSAGTRDLALFARWGRFGWVSAGGKGEHGGADVAAVVAVVEGWAGHEGGEEEDVAGVVEDAGELADGMFLLEGGEFGLREAAVLDVPAESCELRDVRQ